MRDHHLHLTWTRGAAGPIVTGATALDTVQVQMYNGLADIILRCGCRRITHIYTNWAWKGPN
jgi:hypothetical protein